MSHLTPPTPFTAYSNIDPATPNAVLHTELMPKGLFDHEKRVWLQMQSDKLKELGKCFWEQYGKTGRQSDLSLSEALYEEADQCRKASKRKHLDYQPLLK
jgi:hypothetical protein